MLLRLIALMLQGATAAKRGEERRALATLSREIRSLERQAARTPASRA
ncbi:MAG: hypothetical protein L3J93_04800 [Thermoplasmata archaeon]|nr:hypothetical protein [Thermoplasmata archaeon]